MDRVIESRKVRRDILAYLYSDLHYKSGDNIDYLYKSLLSLKKDNPDYVFFLGDLIHDAGISMDGMQELFAWLYELVKYTKVILVLGNHDQLTKSIKDFWQPSYNEALVQVLKDIGVVVLQNQIYEDEDICVYGMHFPGLYYESLEPKDEFYNNMYRVDFTKSNKFNVLLEHSPKNTFDSLLMPLFYKLYDLDLVLAGHYHNGCIPWYLERILKGNYGIIDSYAQMFPRIARGEVEITDNLKGILVSPITTLVENPLLNKLYPPVDQRLLIKKI